MKYMKQDTGWSYVNVEKLVVSLQDGVSVGQGSILVTDANEADLTFLEAWGEIMLTASATSLAKIWSIGGYTGTLSDLALLVPADDSSRATCAGRHRSVVVELLTAAGLKIKIPHKQIMREEAAQASIRENALAGLRKSVSTVDFIRACVNIDANSPYNNEASLQKETGLTRGTAQRVYAAVLSARAQVPESHYCTLSASDLRSLNAAIAGGSSVEQLLGEFEPETTVKKITQKDWENLKRKIRTGLR